MTQRQQATTDRLVSVIQSIQLGRKTGILTARRGSGVTSEEGVVTFVNGQVVEARAGRRGGSVALNWLSTWGYSRYAFVSPTTDEVVWSHTSSSANIFRSQKITDSLPMLGIQRPTTGRLPTRIESAPQALIPPSARSLRSTKDLQGTTTPPLGADAEANAASRQPVVPYRTQLPESALRVIERTGLSRTHRHLFLLVDGRRSMTELTRLIGKREQDLVELLDDLQRASLVRVPDV
jgi:hypothetical protein